MSVYHIRDGASRDADRRDLYNLMGRRECGQRRWFPGIALREMRLTQNFLTDIRDLCYCRRCLVAGPHRLHDWQ